MPVIFILHKQENGSVYCSIAESTKARRWNYFAWKNQRLCLQVSKNFFVFRFTLFLAPTMNDSSIKHAKNIIESSSEWLYTSNHIIIYITKFREEHKTWIILLRSSSFNTHEIEISIFQICSSVINRSKWWDWFAFEWFNNFAWFLFVFPCNSFTIDLSLDENLENVAYRLEVNFKQSTVYHQWKDGNRPFETISVDENTSIRTGNTSSFYYALP